MPSTYLYLNNKNRKLGTNKAIWEKLPVISRATRQCFLSICQAGFQIETANVDDRFLIKMDIPSENYYSSDANENGVVVCSLTSTRIVEPRTVYQLYGENGEPIEILTNDNLSRAEFTIIQANGDIKPITDTDVVDIMIKYDYPEVEEIQNTYVATLPRKLL